MSGINVIPNTITFSIQPDSVDHLDEEDDVFLLPRMNVTSNPHASFESLFSQYRSHPTVLAQVQAYGARAPFGHELVLSKDVSEEHGYHCMEELSFRSSPYDSGIAANVTQMNLFAKVVPIIRISVKCEKVVNGVSKRFRMRRAATYLVAETTTFGTIVDKFIMRLHEERRTYSDFSCYYVEIWGDIGTGEVVHARGLYQRKDTAKYGHINNEFKLYLVLRGREFEGANTSTPVYE